jgi:hypothetical protein
MTTPPNEKRLASTAASMLMVVERARVGSTCLFYFKAPECNGLRRKAILKTLDRMTRSATDSWSPEQPLAWDSYQNVRFSFANSKF